jgi:hypothetical protein
MEQDVLSFIKISSKFNAPFSFNGKIIPTKKCDRACFFTKSLIMFYCLLLEKQEVILLTSDDEKLDEPM